MRKLLCLVALVTAVGLAVPAFAGDIVAMPTGNMMPKGMFEFNYIYWDLEAPDAYIPPYPYPEQMGGAPPDYAHIFEFFYGVTDRLEADVLVVDVDNDDTYVEGNLYYSLIKEQPGKPSLIVGATNITGSKWLGDNRISPFVLTAFNIACPEGKPSFNDPLVRAHVAWGANFHEDKLFGGLQFLFTPSLGAAAFNYQGDPSYLAAYRVSQALELRAGWKAGTPFYSFGYDTSF
jgi:hypothetical protein